MIRATLEVMQDHLRRRAAEDLQGDLEQNYAPDVLLLCEHGALRGHAAISQSATRLKEQLGEATFEYSALHVEDAYGLLLWRAHSAQAQAEHGVDAFVVADGHIVMQSVYYQLLPITR